MSSPAYATVLGTLPEASLLISSRAVIQFANPPAGALFGCPPESLKGRLLSDYVVEHGTALGDLVRMWSRSRGLTPAGLTLKCPDVAPVRLRCDGAMLESAADGSAGLLLLRLTPAQTANKNFIALNLRIQELTTENLRRRRAEAELRAQSEFLKVTLSSIGDAVITTGPDGRVTFMNPVAIGLTGWTAEDAANRPLDEIFHIVHEATREPVENPVTKVFRHGRVVGLANHTTLIARDGTEHSIDDSAAPIRDEDGQILGVVLVFHDVTERRALEIERDQTERRKDEFLAMLGHELRNPLAAVMNCVHLLRLTKPAPQTDSRAPVFLDLVERMERQGRHLIRLVDDLLDTARITTGKFELNTAVLPLQTVISTAVDMCRSALVAQQIYLEIEQPEGSLLVEADGSRLAQVFGNLITNAIKYNTHGGTVRVTARRDDDDAVVTVVDDGIGIAPDVLRHIFELFMQADKSLARASGGLGVGLTVSRLITEMHGGSISADSDGLGHGSRFTVRLPLASRGTAAEPPASGDPGVTAVDAPRRILVVDDNADAAASLAMLLGLSSHEVWTASNGDSALRMAREMMPDVVLLDVGLPDIDGYEVARRLRQGATSRTTLIIAVTGYGADRDRQRAQEAGFDHHLTKPVDLDALAALIASHDSVP